MFPVEFGRYELLGRLAVGGMAEVFSARMQGAHEFHKSLAIKKILPHLAADDEFVSMFIREAKLTAQLSHPNIVQVFELGQSEGELFIVMELVDGPDLLNVLRSHAARDKRVPEPMAIHIAHQVLEALDYAHNARDGSDEPLELVHRDVSPGNVLLSRSGDIKLTDFGIARAATRDGSDSGALKGKYSYMSPEQVLRNPLDARSDLFTVSVVLAELLLGRRLFVAARDLDTLLMVRDARLERLHKFGGHISPELRDILVRGLARRPEDRFRSAEEFRDVLGDHLYQRRIRISPTDVAAMVDDVLAHLPAGEEESFERHSTFSGPDTQRRRLAQEEAERLAREQAEVLSDSGAIPVLVTEEEATSKYVPGPIAVLGDLEPQRGDEGSGRGGDFAIKPPLRVLYELAVEGATGLLEVELTPIRKDVYFVDGCPHYVTSNVARERIGEYLVERGLISDGELALALSVLDRFDGRLIDALVGLDLLDPLLMARALTEQVRDKIVDICTWQKGNYRWFQGRQCPHEGRPMQLDMLSILGAGGMRLDADFVRSWVRSNGRMRPRRRRDSGPLAGLDLGNLPQYVYALADTHDSLGELHEKCRDKDNGPDMLRMVYMLVQFEYLSLEAS